MIEQLVALQQLPDNPNQSKRAAGWLRPWEGSNNSACCRASEGQSRVGTFSHALGATLNCSRGLVSIRACVLGHLIGVLLRLLLEVLGHIWCLLGDCLRMVVQQV